MSALDDYRAWCREHVRTSPGFTKADAAIAELEAENAKCEEWGKSEARMKEQAEAERDLLMAQECEGCEHDIEGVARQCARGVSVDGDIPSTDFACNCWTARAEEGSGT